MQNENQVIGAEVAAPQLDEAAPAVTRPVRKYVEMRHMSRAERRAAGFKVGHILSNETTVNAQGELVQNILKVVDNSQLEGKHTPGPQPAPAKQAKRILLPNMLLAMLFMRAGILGYDFSPTNYLEVPDAIA
ncbi:hypothetical protein [Rhizobacter sp. Root404]|uniref:hypothetical protein n=1 Tax=Rhizobacter sp. Root404 TaxID=1736528 RepID=UPI0006F6A718|nr:hypothetical protein [Rhizobacter sp. Root404]KQW36739.1 hypothetical protein ASC76_19070 [Rhizobacter sp. Root404]